MTGVSEGSGGSGRSGWGDEGSTRTQHTCPSCSCNHSKPATARQLQLQASKLQPQRRRYSQRNGATATARKLQPQHTPLRVSPTNTHLQLLGFTAALLLLLALFTAAAAAGVCCCCCITAAALCCCCCFLSLLSLCLLCCLCVRERHTQRKSIESAAAYN